MCRSARKNLAIRLYVGRIDDERLLKEAGFYLAVRSQMPEAKLIEGVPRVVKIASRDVIDSLSARPCRASF